MRSRAAAACPSVDGPSRSHFRSFAKVRSRTPRLGHCLNIGYGADADLPLFVDAKEGVPSRVREGGDDLAPSDLDTFPKRKGLAYRETGEGQLRVEELDL
jgi:hypothetical protein